MFKSKKTTTLKDKYNIREDELAFQSPIVDFFRYIVKSVPLNTRTIHFYLKYLI